MRRPAAVACVAGLIPVLAGVAQAEIAELTIDPARSSIETQIQVNWDFGGDFLDADAVRVPAIGEVTINVATLDDPGRISVVDFTIEAEEAIAYEAGFPLPGVDYFNGTLSSLTVSHSTLPTPSVSVGANGAFSTNSIMVAEGTSQLTGWLSGVGNVSFPLSYAAGGSESGPLENASIRVVGNELELRFEIARIDSVSTGAPSGVFVIAYTEATVVATAPLSTGPTPCNDADLAEPFGALNFADVQSFLGQFNAQGAPADLAAPTDVWNFADVQSFLGQFNAGC